jgi:predicted transposase YbfD/YdcC
LEKWRCLKSIIEVRRISHHNGKCTDLSEEVHYFLSSLPAQSEALGKRIRNHWLVENQCHWILNITYGEDHCQIQAASAAENLSLLRELTAKFLKVAAVKRSMASVRKEACLSPCFLPHGAPLWNYRQLWCLSPG